MGQLVIDLTDSERQRLAEIAQRLGKPEAAIAHVAVAMLLQLLRDSQDQSLAVLAALIQQLQTEFGQPTQANPTDDALSAAFGLWKDRGIDPIAHQQSLRSEWDQLVNPIS